MKVTKKIIKAMAIEDMYRWISNFENNGEIDEYDEEMQKVYWSCIERMQERLYKKL